MAMRLAFLDTCICKLSRLARAATGVSATGNIGLVLGTVHAVGPPARSYFPHGHRLGPIPHAETPRIVLSVQCV